MKCEVCVEKLDEYLDGELSAAESSEVTAHLVTCESCSSESSTLMAEQEMFARYDREIEVPASMWSQIAGRTVVPGEVRSVPLNLGERIAAFFRVPSFGLSLVGAAALIIIALVVGAAYLQSNKPKSTESMASKPEVKPSAPVIRDEEEPEATPAESPKPNRYVAVTHKSKKSRPRRVESPVVDQSDVLSTEYGYQDMDDRDTALHLEQTQNLLRSIRNVSLSDGDQEIDVTYDKALSRRLLNENIVLRRDAEMKAKFPAKSLLSDLEPFLIDIANLPDHAKPNEVRVIKERVQKTEIVAALIGY